MSVTTPAVAADGLGVRFGRTHALRDCTFALPSGRISALVGPNGAGKTTLMHVAAGLLSPTAGSLTVWGETPGTRGAPEGMAFVSQAKPLYKRFTVTDMMRVGRKLNTRWDTDLADKLVAEAGIDPARRVGALSAGQRTRVALVLALARRPRLVVLDEPFADLDPLARTDTMKVLMRATADDGLTVLLSSHVIAELEDICDHLLLMARGGVHLDGDIDTIVDEHHIAVGPAGALPFTPDTVVEVLPAPRQTTVMLRGAAPATPGWEFTRPRLEDVVMAHLRRMSTDGREVAA